MKQKLNANICDKKTLFLVRYNQFSISKLYILYTVKIQFDLGEITNFEGIVLMCLGNN